MSQLLISIDDRFGGVFQDY